MPAGRGPPPYAHQPGGCRCRDSRRLVPSCAPDSMNDVRPVMSNARRAPTSPAPARARSRDRSTAMRPNSCATKYPVSAVISRTTTTPSKMLSSVLTTGPPPDSGQRASSVSAEGGGRWYSRGHPLRCPSTSWAICPVSTSTNAPLPNASRTPVNRVGELHLAPTAAPITSALDAATRTTLRPPCPASEHQDRTMAASRRRKHDAPTPVHV